MPSDLGAGGDEQEVAAKPRWAMTTATGEDGLELDLPMIGLAVSAPRRQIWPWLTMAESWQSAQRHPGPVVFDTAICVLAVSGVAGSVVAGLAAAGVFAVSGLVLGLFLPRTCVESQGVSWYARRLLPTLVAVAAATGLAHPAGLSMPRAWAAAGAAAGGLLGAHLALWMAIAAARRRGRGLRPTLVVGNPTRARQLRHRLDTFPEAGLCFRSAAVPGPSPVGAGDDGRAWVDRLLDDNGADHVLMAVDGLDEEPLWHFVHFARGRADVSVVAPMAALSAGRTQARLGDVGLLPLRLAAGTGSEAAKRAVDVFLSAVLLTVAGPFLAAVALAVRLGDRGPAIFRQPRVGRSGRVFTMYKFRSMVVGAESMRPEFLAGNVNDGLLFKLDRDPRVTPVGALIRRLSIDELPQLINVLKGDMSLVGPRPLPVSPAEFEPSAQVRHSVLPGMTGLWQVEGANALPYGDMLDLDLTYVVTRSLGTDLRLLARTLPALLVRRSAY